MAPSRPKAELEQELIKNLRTLHRAQDEDQRTSLKRIIGELTVDLREYFITDDGNPDWAGRTWKYRDFMRDCYSEAGFKQDEARKVQTSVRYHVSRYIRERLSPDELASLDLKESPQADRSREAYQRRSQLLSAARALNLGDSNNVLRGLVAALVTLRETPPEAIEALDGTSREQVAPLLDELAERAAALAAIARGAATAG
ncbi:hypothetical protein KRMM14A1259_22050 [Krasilnikovia sp. MM14-A1259]